MLSRYKHNPFLRAMALEVPGPKVTLQGQFDFEVRRNGELTKKVTGPSPNIILDAAIARFGIGSDYFPFQYCHVGTGTSVPSGSQTQLDAYVAGVTWSSGGSGTNSGAPNYVLTSSLNFVFAQGAVIGNISEVGVGRQLATGNLSSRALVLDEFSAPTTVPLTSLDQLTVIYRLSMSRNLTPTAGTVFLNGVAYPYTANLTAAAQVGTTLFAQPTGTMLKVSFTGNGVEAHRAGTPLSPTVLTDTGVPGSTGSQFPISIPSATYSSPSAGVGKTVFTIPPAGANFTGGIQLFRLSFEMFAQPFYVIYYFSTPVPKDNTFTLVLGLQGSWSRP